MYKPAKLLYVDLEEQHLVETVGYAPSVILFYDNYVEQVNDTHQRDINFRFGSVLGPTLFCICVNDLATYPTIANLIYADDVEYEM